MDVEPIEETGDLIVEDNKDHEVRNEQIEMDDPLEYVVYNNILNSISSFRLTLL